MKTSLLDYLLCGILLSLISALSLAVTIGLGASLPSFSYKPILGIAFFLISFGLLCGLTIHLLLRFKPLTQGTHDMNSTTFTYWKVLVMLVDFGHFALAPFELLFLRPLITTLLGAKVGKDTAIAGSMTDPFMVSIGDYSVIGSGSHLCGNFTQNGQITIGPVQIGKHVTIGVNAVILPNTRIDDGVAVGIGSVVMPGTHIPAGEVWCGNPARKWQ